MGRSVMTHPRAEVEVYTNWEEGRYSFCRFCDEEVVENNYEWEQVGINDDPTFCPIRQAELIEENGGYFEGVEKKAVHEGHEYDSDNFTDDLDAVTSYMKELWPSLEETDEWPHNEVHVFLHNALAEISVSEYCGLISLCVAIRDSAIDDGNEGIARHWIEQMAPKFRETFGQYNKVGTFSNGEAVYTKEDK